MKRRIGRALLALAALLIVAAAAFVAWAETTNPIGADAAAALEPGGGVRVEQGEWLAFHPAGDAAGGVIFYPGGRVDARAYAPLMRRIAEGGALAVIVPMPLNLAVLGSRRAGDVIAAYPETDTWVIAGHSLGGAMAAAYADQHPGAVDGLALLAAYPAGSNSLADDPLRVVSIYATEDGLATVEEVEASRPLLPAGATFVEIEGGNHAGFGSYGAQRGDGTASLPPAEQQAQTAGAILDLLAAAGGGGSD